MGFWPYNLYVCVVFPIEDSFYCFLIWPFASVFNFDWLVKFNSDDLGLYKIVKIL